MTRSPDSAGAPLRGYVAELDGLRGIATLGVLLYHFWPRSGFWAAYSTVPHLGWIGVDLFFVISGFLITGILLDTRGEDGYFRNFYARRFLRIFPLYYLFLATVFTLIPLAQGAPPFFDTEFVRGSGSPLWYVLYLANVREAIVGTGPGYLLAPLWSLSIEEQFYVCFPLIVAALTWARLARLLLGLVLLAPLFRAVMFFLFPANERIQYVATFSRMDVIALGCLLAVILRYRPDRLSRGRSRVLLGATGGLAGVAWLVDGLNRTMPFTRLAGYSLLAFAFASLVLWTILRRDEPTTAVLRWKPLMGLGKICYGVYLLQRPAEILLLKTLDAVGVPHEPGSLGLMVAKMAFATAVGALSWVVFEKRVLRLKARFVSRGRPAG